MTDLSYVVSCYKQRTFLLQIRSMLAKASEDVRARFEVVIVDDDPAGGQIERLKKDWEAFECARVVVVTHVKNEGVAAARNTGTGLAIGKWVNYIDGDDVVLPEHAELMLEEASRRPNVAVVECGEFNWFTLFPPDRELLDEIATPAWIAKNVKLFASGEPFDADGNRRTSLSLHGGLHRMDGIPRHSDVFSRWSGIGGNDVDFSIRSESRGACAGVRRALCGYRVLSKDQRNEKKAYTVAHGMTDLVVGARLAKFLGRDHEPYLEKIKAVVSEKSIAIAGMLRRVLDGEIDDSEPREFRVEFEKVNTR